MTDLLDRWKNPAQADGTVPIAQDKIIPNHTFSSEIVLATLGFATRDDIIATWTLVGDEVTQLDAIITVYQGKTDAEKVDYLQTIIAGAIVREGGIITKVQLETILEI